MAHSHGPDHDGVAYLHCPRCRLSMSPRVARIGVRHCPRCVARARVAVELFSSPLRGEELWAGRGGGTAVVPDLLAG